MIDEGLPTRIAQPLRGVDYVQLSLWRVGDGCGLGWHLTVGCGLAFTRFQPTARTSGSRLKQRGQGLPGVIGSHKGLAH